MAEKAAEGYRPMGDCVYARYCEHRNTKLFSTGDDRWLCNPCYQSKNRWHNRYETYDGWEAWHIKKLERKQNRELGTVLRDDQWKAEVKYSRAVRLLMDLEFDEEETVDFFRRYREHFADAAPGRFLELARRTPEDNDDNDDGEDEPPKSKAEPKRDPAGDDQAGGQSERKSEQPEQKPSEPKVENEDKAFDWDEFCRTHLGPGLVETATIGAWLQGTHKGPKPNFNLVVKMLEKEKVGLRPDSPKLAKIDAVIARLNQPGEQPEPKIEPKPKVAISGKRKIRIYDVKLEDGSVE